MSLSTACLEKLDEFVNQEDRIVTYRWFSQQTGVSVASAKQALELFVKHCRGGNVQYTITVTHLVIGGETKADGRKVTHVCVVDEDQLEAVKSSLKTAGSCHVYSVQKAKVKDSSALYAADVEQRHEKWRTSSQYSAIHCPAAVCGTARAPAKAAAKPSTSVPEVKTKASTTSSSATVDDDTQRQDKTAKQEDAPAPQANGGKSTTAAAAAKGKAARGKQPSAASFFGAAAAKKSVKKEENATKEKPAADSKADDEKSSSAGAVGKKEVKKEGNAASSASSSKSTSFFGERLPKKKTEAEPKKEEPVQATADKENGDGKKEERKEEKKPAAKKPAATKAKNADDTKKRKPASRASKQEPASEPATTIDDDILNSDLFDAECDSDEPGSAEKPLSKKRSPAKGSKATKQSSAPDLSDLYDAEESDEEFKPAKKGRGRPKKTPVKEAKPTAKSKKELGKGQQTLKRARMDDDDQSQPEENSEPVEEPKRAPEPPVPHGPRRKRVKKMVTKTHINEAGEFVTEKVYETDSTDASDEEVMPAAKRMKIASPVATTQSKLSGAGAATSKGGKKADPKKAGPAGKAKQSSLMSFFKK